MTGSGALRDGMSLKARIYNPGKINNPKLIISLKKQTKTDKIAFTGVLILTSEKDR